MLLNSVYQIGINGILANGMENFALFMLGIELVFTDGMCFTNSSPRKVRNLTKDKFQ